ncbi:MAG: hypothetical protein HY303_14200 [Candidatus Wallbacteria bacterium]|nr:hypothetical protein [Candidatus Wallbacteria bacterium]
MAWSEPRLLSQRDARTLAALAEVLVPLDAEDVPLGRVDLVARIERLLEGENRVFLRMTRLALWMLEYSPPFCGEGIARFSRLAADGRQRCVAWWETRPSWRLRNIYYLCKITVLSHYYDDEAVAAAVGYRP